MPRRFQFPLQTLLRVRQQGERDAQRKLAAQRAVLARFDQLDEAAHEQIRTQQAALLSAQGQTDLNLALASRGRAWIAQLRRELTLRQLQRQQELATLATLQEQLRVARQQAKVLEKLRERRHDEWHAAHRRAEQNESDELARQLLIFRQAASDDAAGPERVEC